MLERFGSASLALAACFLSLAHAADGGFAGRLSTVPIDPATQADVTGHGRVTAELRGRELVIRGTFEGLKGPATVARLHGGTMTGVRGPAIADLDVDGGTAGSIAGTLRLTDEQIEALNAGRLYVQLHSERAPDGNLWGWLLP